MYYYISTSYLFILITVYAECTSEQFTCNNQQCIANTRKCDFKLDCTDGSDEWQSTCGLSDFNHWYIFLIYVYKLIDSIFQDISLMLNRIKSSINLCLLCRKSLQWVYMFFRTMFKWQFDVRLGEWLSRFVTRGWMG